MQKYYHTQHGSVMNVRGNRNSFVQLVGEHAVRFIHLAKADRKNDKRLLMSTWAHITKLNDEWISLLCPVSKEDEFASITGQLVTGYAEVLGDYILDTHLEKTREKVQHITGLEADFYAGLVDKQLKDATRKQWADYTHSIGSMVSTLDQYGDESDAYYCAAANCIYSAQLLGSWLDIVI